MVARREAEEGALRAPHGAAPGAASSRGPAAPVILRLMITRGSTSSGHSPLDGSSLTQPLEAATAGQVSIANRYDLEGWDPFLTTAIPMGRAMLAVILEPTL